MKGNLIVWFLCIFAGVKAQIPTEAEFEQLLARGKYYEVLQQISSLQQQGQDIPALYYYGGKANEGIMRYNEAYRYYLKWYESDTTQFAARLTVARIANLAGHRAEAIKWYEQLAAQDSLNFTVNYALGRLYQQSGKLSAALQVYRRQYEVDTTNITLLTRMGDCLSDAGNVVRAFPLYITAFNYDVRNSALAIKMGNLLLTNRDFIPVFGEAVEKAIDTVAHYYPASVNVRQSQGVLKYALKKYIDAQYIFTDILQLNDSSKINYKFLAFSLFQQRRYQQSLRMLYVADSLYRNADNKLTDIEVGIKYAEALSRNWQAEKALEKLEEVWTVVQPDPRLLSQISLLRGMSYSVMGKKEEAIQYYWDAYQKNHSNHSAIANMAYMSSSLWNSARENKTEANYRLIWYLQILYLQQIKEKSDYEGSQHNYSRKILEEALETLFFTGENQLEVTDPDGKVLVYPQEEIRQLIKKN